MREIPETFPNPEKHMEGIEKEIEEVMEQRMRFPEYDKDLLCQARALRDEMGQTKDMTLEQERDLAYQMCEMAIARSLLPGDFLTDSARRFYRLTKDRKDGFLRLARSGKKVAESHHPLSPDSVVACIAGYKGMQRAAALMKESIRRAKKFRPQPEDALQDSAPIIWVTVDKELYKNPNRQSGAVGMLDQSDIDSDREIFRPIRRDGMGSDASWKDMDRAIDILNAAPHSEHLAVDREWDRLRAAHPAWRDMLYGSHEPLPHQPWYYFKYEHHSARRIPFMSKQPLFLGKTFADLPNPHDSLFKILGCGYFPVLPAPNMLAMREIPDELFAEK